MKLVYIFDPRDAWGIDFPVRLPTPLARPITRLARRWGWDYAESERGEWKDHYPTLDFEDYAYRVPCAARGKLLAG